MGDRGQRTGDMGDNWQGREKAVDMCEWTRTTNKSHMA